MSDCKHELCDVYESDCKRCGVSAKEIVRELEAENQRLRDALTTVREWKLPRVKDRHGMETSYEWEYGSNGVRDYMKTIANVALLGGGENG